MAWEKPSSPQNFRPEPWLHPDVIQYLNNLIQPEWEVLEHGSGGSTLWLAERCKSVVSLEHNPEWYYQVFRKAPDNVTLILGSELPAGRKYDMFFIDGYRYERPMWIKLSPQLVKPGGLIVLDNSNRPEYATGRSGLMKLAKSYKVFDHNHDQYRYIVTDFYWMK